MGIEAWEGRAEFHKHFGREELTCIWNFESTRPLRLNIHPTATIHFAAIRSLDHHRLMIRFGSDIEVMSQPDVFDGPGTMVLTRTEEGHWEGRTASGEVQR
jgi:hypothetical protein